MSISNAVVIDANILVAICSKEQDTHPVASSVFNSYAQTGYEFFAPNAIISEVLFALCVKLRSGVLIQANYDIAIDTFADLMQMISMPSDESALIKRAVGIRGSYDCKRTSDSLYIAFAEDLAKTRAVELVTFDNGMKNQIANFAPTVALNLLSI